MVKLRGDGIFCLEGEWSNDLRDRRSVRPILTLLAHLGVAESIHRDVATVEEFEYLVGRWQQKRYDDFKVLYLAMHGDEGRVLLGRDEVNLDRLEEMMKGACAGKVVYFGSCLTMRSDPARLQSFAKVTKARAVVGYRREVEWLESAAFEVLLLDRLALGLRSDAIYNRLVNDHGAFAKSLGLVVATPRKVHRVPLRVSRGASGT